MAVAVVEVIVFLIIQPIMMAVRGVQEAVAQAVVVQLLALEVLGTHPRLLQAKEILVAMELYRGGLMSLAVGAAVLLLLEPQ
jgi:hypothetical protein